MPSVCSAFRTWSALDLGLGWKPLLPCSQRVAVLSSFNREAHGTLAAGAVFGSLTLIQQMPVPAFLCMYLPQHHKM